MSTGGSRLARTSRWSGSRRCNTSMMNDQSSTPTLRTIRLSKWASRNPGTDGSLSVVQSRCHQTIAPEGADPYNLIGHPQNGDFATWLHDPKPADAEAKMHSFLSANGRTRWEIFDERPNVRA